jgi:hypothetical protein
MPGKKGSTPTREKPRKAKKAATPKNSMPKGNAQKNKPHGENQWDVNSKPQNSVTQNWQDRQPMNTPPDPNRRASQEVMEDEDTEVGV